MPFRKRHNVPKKIARPAKPIVKTDEPSAANLPTKAEHLLDDSKNVQLLENVLNQINAYYDDAFGKDNEVLPIFVGITPSGLLVELSVVREKSQAGEQVSGDSLNVFTYEIGTELTEDLKPREIAEVNMVKGQEQIRLHNEQYPMPDVVDGKAIAKWRFTEAETIQLKTMGIYEIQPENYEEIAYGNGIKALGGSEGPIIPLQHFAAELK